MSHPEWTHEYNVILFETAVIEIRTSKSAIRMDHYVHLPRNKQENAKCETFVDYGQQMKHQAQIKMKIFHNYVVYIIISNEQHTSGRDPVVIFVGSHSKIHHCKLELPQLYIPE